MIPSVPAILDTISGVMRMSRCRYSGLGVSSISALVRSSQGLASTSAPLRRPTTTPWRSLLRVRVRVRANPKPYPHPNPNPNLGAASSSSSKSKPCARATWRRASREGSRAPLVAAITACLLRVSASCRLGKVRVGARMRVGCWGWGRRVRVSFELLPGVEVLAVLEELIRHRLQHELARRLKRLLLRVPLLRRVALLLLLHAGRLGLLLCPRPRLRLRLRPRLRPRPRRRLRLGTGLRTCVSTCASTCASARLPTGLRTGLRTQVSSGLRRGEGGVLGGVLRAPTTKRDDLALEVGRRVLRAQPGHPLRDLEAQRLAIAPHRHRARQAAQLGAQRLEARLVRVRVRVKVRARLASGSGSAHGQGEWSVVSGQGQGQGWGVGRGQWSGSGLGFGEGPPLSRLSRWRPPRAATRTASREGRRASRSRQRPASAARPSSPRLAP